jgi:hypothetical protein
VEDLEQGHLLTLDTVGGCVDISVLNGECRVAGIAGAAGASTAFAAKFGLLSATGLLAGELALGLGAQGGGLALPGALGLLAQRRAVGLGGSAGGAAHSRAAHGLACGAALQLAHILGAAHGAHGLLTVDLALGALRLFAVHLALGAGAHGVALGRADRIVAQPFALRVALCGRGDSHEAEGENDLQHLR